VQRGQQGEELVGLAAGGEGEDEVAGGDHAEVAMQRLGRVKEVRGRAGGAQGRGDLARDEAGLADAEEDELVAGGARLEDELGGAGEGLAHGAVEADGEFKQGAGLDADEVGRARGLGGWHRHGCGQSRC
jgi:hypothetical protein